MGAFDSEGTVNSGGVGVGLEGREVNGDVADVVVPCVEDLDFRVI